MKDNKEDSLPDSTHVVVVVVVVSRISCFACASASFFPVFFHHAFDPRASEDISNVSPRYGDSEMASLLIANDISDILKLCSAKLEIEFPTCMTKGLP